MSAPFYRFGAFNDEVSLIVAFLIGIGFGFFLERAGFGSARKLTAQFYFKDLAVLKVMFTAIVTAAAGLYLVSRLGLVDLSLVHLTPTLLVPQIVGGVLLGVGFVIGGYCPGTSVVSAATGRIDAVVYLLGMTAGLFGFAEVYPAIADWAGSTNLGKLTLSSVTGLPYGVVVLAVVLMALGAFLAAEWAERRFGGLQHGASALTGALRPLNASRTLALGLVAVGAFAAVGGSPYREGRVTIETRQLARLAGHAADHVTAPELAAWILAGRADYTLIDLRSAEEFAAHRIPGARHVPLAELTDDVAPRTEKVVLYSQDDTHSAQAWILLKALGFKAVYALSGGLEAWDAEVFFPAKPTEETPEALADFEKRGAVARHFGGTPRGVSAPAAGEMPAILPPPPSVEAPAAPSGAPARKKREGC
jgi:rhodanese-related sulfurtransferase